MTFLVAIHKDAASSFGVSVPDLPGCITAGDTIDDALSMARQAILIHLEGLLDDGMQIPEPTADIQKLQRDPDFADAVLWAAVQVELDWKRQPSAA